MSFRLGWLIVLGAALACSQAFADETWTCRDEFGDEDDYLIVEERMIPKKRGVVLTIFRDKDDVVIAYGFYWSAHQPPTQVYSYFAINRRNGWFNRWDYLASKPVTGRSLAGRIGTCTRR